MADRKASPLAVVIAVIVLLAGLFGIYKLTFDRGVPMGGEATAPEPSGEMGVPPGDLPGASPMAPGAPGGVAPPPEPDEAAPPSPAPGGP